MTFFSTSGTSNFTISLVWTSAKERYKVSNSGKLVNFENLVFARYPCPEGDNSNDVVVSPKFAAQASKNGIFNFSNVYFWR